MNKEEDLSRIPIELYEAAETLHKYYKERNVTDWEFSHAASRLTVFRLQREVATLKYKIKTLKQK